MALIYRRSPDDEEEEDADMGTGILDTILSTLNTNSDVQDIRQGYFWTASVTKNCGLASTPHDPGSTHGEPLVQGAGHLLEMNTLSLVRMAYSGSATEAALGLATVNSLLDIDESACIEINASDLIEEKGRDRCVAIVGHFPFVNSLRRKVRELWVIERNPRGDDLEEKDAERYVPRADVVAITGSTLVNHSLERFLKLCNPKAFVLVLGPSTPLTPVLFEYGVDVIAGTKVIDAETVLRHVSQGANFKQMKGVRLLTMQRA
jgi:hypothetical protein